MTEKKTPSGQTVDLRKQAEERARGIEAQSPNNIDVMSPEETRQILHELRVHQIELEMQNEELRRTQAKLEASRVRYIDLYDLAPVGYCTLSEKGLILETNLTAATMLGVARSALVKCPLTRFILKKDQAIYHGHCKLLFETHSTSSGQACELRMVKKDGTEFWVHLVSVAAEDADGAPVCRITLNDITAERRQVENAMRELEDKAREEALYHSLVDMTSEGFWLLDKEFMTVYVNPALENMLGYAKEELFGRSWYDFGDPEWVARAKELEKRRVSGIKEPHPFLFIRKNGSKVLTRIATTPLYDEAGNFNGAIGILSDITRQNETEKALRENQALLNEMGKMVKVGGWELDADTLHVRWTEEIYRIHELPPGSTPPLEEAINYFHPEEREKLSDSVQRAFKYGEAYDMELRFITARGKHLWTRTICIPEVVDGKTVRLKGTLQDITKHKQVEEALLQEQQFSKLVLDNLPGIFYLYTYPERRLVLWNKQHETLLGYTAEELKDRFATDWYPPKGKDAVLKATEEVMEKGHSSAESFLLAKDGHRIPFFLTGIRFEAQGRLYYMGIGTDITDRKLAEEKIKASLLEKETMLKEIHHRVKNNLQVISSLLDLQSSYLQDEKVREIFQSSRNRVNAMANIHTLLYQSEDLARIDFGAFIRDLTGRLQQSYGIAESPAEIHVNVSDVSLTIETSLPCGLILNELVTNALKHAFPQGREGKVNISMKAEGDQFTLTVSDNGIGFPEAVDFQNTKSLGLELVNLLVGQMNGAIDLTVEGGTTFTITFSTVSNGGSAHGKEKDHDC